MRIALFPTSFFARSLYDGVGKKSWLSWCSNLGLVEILLPELLNGNDAGVNMALKTSVIKIAPYRHPQRDHFPHFIVSHIIKLEEYKMKSRNLL